MRERDEGNVTSHKSSRAPLRDKSPAIITFCVIISQRPREGREGRGGQMTRGGSETEGGWAGNEEGRKRCSPLLTAVKRPWVLLIHSARPGIHHLLEESYDRKMCSRAEGVSSRTAAAAAAATKRGWRTEETRSSVNKCVFPFTNKYSAQRFKCKHQVTGEPIMLLEAINTVYAVI